MRSEVVRSEGNSGSRAPGHGPQHSWDSRGPWGRRAGPAPRRYLGRDVLICRRGSAGMTSTVEPLVLTPGRLSSRQSLKTPNTVVW